MGYEKRKGFLERITRMGTVKDQKTCSPPAPFGHSRRGDRREDIFFFPAVERDRPEKTARPAAPTTKERLVGTDFADGHGFFKKGIGGCRLSLPSRPLTEGFIVSWDVDTKRTFVYLVYLVCLVWWGLVCRLSSITHYLHRASPWLKCRP
jgi:hypothetical protein